MSESPPVDTVAAHIGRTVLRLIPQLGVPPSWWVSREWSRKLAELDQTQPAENPASIEIVSHCWNYASLLVYQLSSLVLAPPQNVRVTMTVCYCEEDEETVKLLEFFGAKEVPGVTWNWMPLPREGLLRRAYGRNQVALRSTADWVWFTDCDMVFAEGCLDGLAAAVTGEAAILVYPEEERTTRMLPPDDPLLAAGKQPDQVLSVEWDQFSVARLNRATGPLQITRGDVVRQVGYCAPLPCFLTGAEHWRKTYEDSAFRWLLGTEGTRVKFPGAYRIKHVVKGRYRGGIISRFRSWIRRTRERVESPDKP